MANYLANYFAQITHNTHTQFMDEMAEGKLVWVNEWLEET